MQEHISLFVKDVIFLPGISFPGIGDEHGAVLVVAFGLKQQPQGFRVFVGVQRRFGVAGIGAHPAGMEADDVQVRIVPEIVAQGHGEHVQGGLFCTSTTACTIQCADT